MEGVTRVTSAQRTELIDLMRKMTHAEQKKVGRACGKLLPMVCVLQLLNELPPKYCPLCRIKRAHEEQYLLEQGLRRKRVKINWRYPSRPTSTASKSEVRTLPMPTA